MKARGARAVVTLIFLGACLGAAECRADDRGLVVPAEQVLRQKLEHAYPTVTRWDIEPLPASTAPQSAATVNHPSITVTRLGERSAVWVGSETLGDHRQGTLLWFSVAGYAPAVTAARPLSAGTSVDSRDGELLERNVVTGDCQPIEDAGALAGMRVRRSVHAGEIICTNLLEAVPPVARGEEVTLRYTGRSFTLTARAVAQADGLLGKRVTVRNVGSGDVLIATVTGKGEVSVNE
jgi:flagella basal body P-ring formation protein FlgA